MSNLLSLKGLRAVFTDAAMMPVQASKMYYSSLQRAAEYAFENKPVGRVAGKLLGGAVATGVQSLAILAAYGIAPLAGPVGAAATYMLANHLFAASAYGENRKAAAQFWPRSAEFLKNTRPAPTR